MVTTPKWLFYVEVVAFAVVLSATIFLTIGALVSTFYIAPALASGKGGRDALKAVPQWLRDVLRTCIATAAATAGVCILLHIDAEDILAGVPLGIVSYLGERVRLFLKGPGADPQVVYAEARKAGIGGYIGVGVIAIYQIVNHRSLIFAVVLFFFGLGMHLAAKDWVDKGGNREN